MPSPLFRRSIPLLLSSAIYPSTSAASGIQLSVGADYSRGNFGSSVSTEIFVVPISARLRWGDWSLRASLPYVTVRGPADVAVVVGEDGASAPESEEEDELDSEDTPEDGVPPPANSASTPTFANNRSVAGLGDASLSLGYAFNALGGTPAYLHLTARTKFSTGSASQGLGVGATDYAALAELGWQGEDYGVYAGGGRRFLGSSSRVQRQDGWQWQAGAWLAATESIELGTSYRGREASTQRGSNAGEVEANVGLRFAKAWRIVGYAGVGLTNGSPDTLGGLTLSWNASRNRY